MVRVTVMVMVPAAPVPCWGATARLPGRQVVVAAVVDVVVDTVVVVGARVVVVVVVRRALLVVVERPAAGPPPDEQLVKRSAAPAPAARPAGSRAHRRAGTAGAPGGRLTTRSLRA
ncbi:MAG: hypothetical protein ACRDY3_01125 [Acidimicrobiales bacterium]